MSESTQEVSTTVDGHSYTILKHPAEEGWPLAAEIMALLAEPFARIVGAWLSSGDVETPEGLPTDIKWEDTGEDIATSLRVLASRPDLVKRIFANTTRDGKALSHPLVFDEAYRGNYREMAKAMMEIVKANGFIPFSF